MYYVVAMIYKNKSNFHQTLVFASNNLPFAIHTHPTSPVLIIQRWIGAMDNTPDCCSNDNNNNNNNNINNNNNRFVV